MNWKRREKVKSRLSVIPTRELNPKVAMTGE